jgi:hypothetical protein
MSSLVPLIADYSDYQSMNWSMSYDCLMMTEISATRTPGMDYFSVVVMYLLLNFYLNLLRSLSMVSMVFRLGSVWIRFREIVRILEIMNHWSNRWRMESNYLLVRNLRIKFSLRSKLNQNFLSKKFFNIHFKLKGFSDNEYFY